MAGENLERVRAIVPPDGTDLVEALGSGRKFSSGGLVSDDAVVRFVARSGEMGGTGSDAFYGSWADWHEPWESYRIYSDELVDRGDRVIWLVRLRGVTKRDGVEMEHDGAAVFRFEGDRVAEVTFTMERETALGD